MFNLAVQMGRLVADPELKSTPNGVSVTTIRLAVNRSFSEKDGERKADFITVVAWRKTAEFICKYFKKGDPILVQGNLQTRQYTDKDDKKQFVTELIAEKVFFAGGKKSAAGNEYDTAAKEKPDAELSDDNYSIPDDDGDLPF